MPTPTTPRDPDRDRQSWLDAIIPLQEGAQLRGVSVETLKREAARGRLQLIRVSERRLGIRRRDALAIGEAKTA